jgi:hypothetical protein
MLARTLLLATALAVGSMVAPGSLGSVSNAQGVQPNWMIPAQGRGERPANILSLREVADMLRSRYGGRLLNANLVGDTYLVVWEMPNGERRDFRVDAVSGQIR